MQPKQLVAACALACALAATPEVGRGAPAIDSLLAEAPPPEPVGGVTIAEALALARRHHPSLRSGAWRVRAAQADQIDAARIPNPTVAIEVENFGGRLSDQLLETTLRAEQVVELGGKRGARGAAAEAMSALALAEVTEEERLVLTATAERFLEAWVLQERVERLVRAERLAQQTVTAAEERHRAGAAPAVERARAEAIHATRQYERLRAAAERASAARRLAAQWGSTAVRFDSLVLVDPAPVRLPPPDSLVALLGSHPERRRAAAEVAVEEARVRWVRGARVPDVTLQGGVRRFSGPDDTEFTAGLSLPVPLWSQSRGAVEAAEAEHAAARTQERLVTVRLDEELRAALERFVAAGEIHETLRTRVQPANENALRQLAGGYREGRFSSLEFIDAQRGLLETEIALIESRAEAWRARLGLERLLGATLEEIGAMEGSR